MLKSTALARYRNTRGYTLESLQAKTGIRKETISRLEKGKEKNPTLRTLELLAHALDVRLIDIIDESIITE